MDIKQIRYFNELQNKGDMITKVEENKMNEIAEEFLEITTHTYNCFVINYAENRMIFNKSERHLVKCQDKN